MYSTVSRSRMLDLQSVGWRPTYRETESCVQLSCEICEVRRLQYYIIVRKTVHRTHCGTVHLRPHQQATRLHLQLNIYLICVCVLTTVHAVRNQALRVGRESGNNCSRGLTPKAVAPLSPHTLSTHLSALGLPTTSPTQPHNLWVRVGAREAWGLRWDTQSRPPGALDCDWCAGVTDRQGSSGRPAT